MKPLAEILMLWCFEIDEPYMLTDVPNSDGLEKIKMILDASCESYSLKIGDHEFTKQDDVEDIHEECEDIEFEKETKFTINKIEISQRESLVGILQQRGFKSVADALCDKSQNLTWYYTRTKCDELRNILEALSSSVDITIGDQTFKF
jgi:hypothetical protein